MKSRSTTFAVSFVAMAAMAFGACSSDSDTKATTTAAPTTAAATTVAPTTATPTTHAATTHPPTTQARSTTTTDNGGGGMSAGAPKFVSFEITPSVACQSGNATATMKWTTENVVDISIKVGDKPFAETAGYGPNETAAVVSIPCTGAGTSKVQLRGCTENETCAESEALAVTITG